MPDVKKQSTVRFILHYLWTANGFSLKLFFTLSLFFLLSSKVLNALVPIAFKSIFDFLASDTSGMGAKLNAQYVPIGIILVYAGLRVSSQVLNELKEATFVLIEQNAVKNIAKQIFAHIHSLSLKFHLNRKSGEITKAVERGVKSVEMILRFSTFNVIPTFFEIIFVCILLAALYPFYYVVTIFLTLFLYSWYTVGVTEMRTKYVRQMKVADNKSGYKAMDSLLNYETVKYFNNEKYEVKSYSALLENYKNLAIKNRIYLSFLNLGQGFIIATGLIIINYLTVKNIIDGSSTIGDFALVNAYLLQLYQPLSNLGFAYREIKLAYIDIESMKSILEEKSEVTEKENAPNLDLKNGSVEFCNVCFGYSSKRQILKNVSFKINPGATTAIVGKSGAGKSTISKLVFRFYDPTSGIVKIDDQDISLFTKQSVHKAIGVVPQDTVLFNDTLYHNIAYGNPKSATNQDIIRVAKLTDIHTFIESLPERYDTIVGERGLKLSGGEKQRIAIARLLLKNPKIFVFDEATSSLDTKTERSIQKSIKEISTGHTTLVIAHRLSTVVEADEIIVLSDGQITERGNHKELVAKSGLYHQMWQSQEKELN